MKSPDKSLSRREFTQKVALTSAAILGLPDLSPAGANADRVPSVNVALPSAQTPANAPKLSPQSQAEGDSRHQAILAQYPDRFSDAQKTDLKRLCILLQAPLDRIRAYSISNGDLPALYLKPLVERDKKSAADSKTGAAKSGSAAAKPAIASPATGKP